VVGVMLMTVWILCLPGLAIRIRSPEPVSAAPTSSPPLSVAEHDPAIPDVPRVRTVQNRISVESVATDQPGVEVRPEAVQPVASSRPMISWPVALLAIWGCGVALLSFRLALALAKVARLLRTSQPAVEEIAIEARRIAAVLGCRRRVQVRTSQIYAVPFQYGLLRPVVVLPERMCAPGYRGQLPGIIAHELAHVMSWDFLWNLAIEVVSTMLWFHPLAWRIGSAHRAACDATCDAVSASYVGDVQAYCRTLAQVALEGAASFPALGLAMARSCDLRRRIAFLQRRLFAGRLGRRAAGGAALAVFALILLLSGVRLAPADRLSPEGGRAVALQADARGVSAITPAGTGTLTPANAPANGKDLYGDPLPAGALARLGTIRYRQVGSAIAFSRDKTVVTFNRWPPKDGASFAWWDVASGKLLRRAPLPGAHDLTRGSITTDGRIAAFIMSRTALQWWDVDTAKELASIPLTDREKNDFDLALSADGATVITSGPNRNGAATVWDRSAKTRIATYSSNVGIRAASLAPDGKHAALVTNTDGVLGWDFAAGQTPRTILRRTKDFQPFAIQYSPDGKTLAVGGWRRDVKILNAPTGRLLRTLDWPHPFVQKLAFSPDGKLLALGNSGAAGNDIVLWDLATGKLIHDLKRVSDRGVDGPAFSPDGRLLAITAGNVLHVWDLATEKNLDASFVGHEGYVEPVVFLGRGDKVATAGSEGAVRHWDARTGRQERMLPYPGLIRALAASPDGKLLASSAETILSDDSVANSVRIWDVGTGRQLHQLAGRGKMGGIRQLCFSPDGKRLAGAGDDGKSRLWSASDGTLLAEQDLSLENRPARNQLPDPFSPLGESLEYAAVFPDADRIVVDGAKGDFRVLSMQTGKEVQVFGTVKNYGRRIAMSTDGKYLLSDEIEGRPVKSMGLYLWDIAAARQVWRQELPYGPPLLQPVTISADAKRFAASVAGSPREIRIGDMATGKTLQSLKNDQQPRCLAFSPDGLLLVAGMEDGTAITWDLSDHSARSQH
jgi:WD40 repeat protein/beta-lactamase regulating signal transducer with metallopeptidase domain